MHPEIFEEGESLVASELTEKDRDATLAITMLFDSREARDGALESGMADRVATSYDRLEEILYESIPSKTAACRRDGHFGHNRPCHRLDLHWTGLRQLWRGTNWSPAKVPFNIGRRTFDVLIADHTVLLNINPTITSYTDKQKRTAEHIEEGYEKCGVSKQEAESRAWATVNKEDKGGKKSGSGRGKKSSKESPRNGGKASAGKRKKEVLTLHPLFIYLGPKVAILELTAKKQ